MFSQLAGTIDVSHLSSPQTRIMGHEKRGAEMLNARDHNESLWVKSQKSLWRSKRGSDWRKYSVVAKGSLELEWLSEFCFRASWLSKPVRHKRGKKWHVVIASESNWKHFKYANTKSCFYKSNHYRWIKHLRLSEFFIVFFGTISLSLLCFICFKL